MKLMILGLAIIMSVEIGLILFYGYPEILSRDIETLLFLFTLVGCLVIRFAGFNMIEKSLKF